MTDIRGAINPKSDVVGGIALGVFSLSFIFGYPMTTTASDIVQWSFTIVMVILIGIVLVSPTGIWDKISWKKRTPRQAPTTPVPTPNPRPLNRLERKIEALVDRELEGRK